jgi:hypothetical protein
MKFVNEFKAGTVQTYGPAGTPHNEIYVDYRDVFDLLVILKESGVKVDKESSEAVYSQTRVPLGTLFPVNRRPTGYCLQGENLYIQLKNYNHSDSNQNPRGPRVIGGSSTRTTAVDCKLVKTLAQGENPYQTLDGFLETCKIVNDFYSALKSGEALTEVRKLVARG